MQNKLSFEIENLASINKADLDIGKINIIIGKNNTGKSTSSKFLFCLLTAISRERIYLANCDIKNRINQLCYLLKFSYFDDNPFSVKDFNLIEDLLNKPNSNELFDEISHKLFVLSKKINSPALKEMYLQQLKKNSGIN